MTHKQLVILNLLYRFRFGTTELIGQATGTDKVLAYKRLQLLLHQGYIERKFDTSYRLLHKPAVYFLSAKGRKILRERSDRYDPGMLRVMSRDVQRSDRFIMHWLSVFAVYCTLQRQYGDGLQFYTPGQLRDLPHFPQSILDAYIRLEGFTGEPRYFMNVLYEKDPYDGIRKIRSYISYCEKRAEEFEEKTNAAMPRVLIVCASASMQKQLVRHMRRPLRSVDSDILEVYTAIAGEIGTKAPWQNILDTNETVAMEDIE